MAVERWVRRRFQVVDQRVETFSAELWDDHPLGLEIVAGGLDVYYREGEAPAWSAPRSGVELVAEDVVTDSDWLAGWRASAVPFALGERFWIDPGELEKAADPRRATLAVEGGVATAPPADRIPLWLPARRAFGTGSHPTTRLAISWLEAIPLAGRDVLDVGAGSGILGFACRKLGARRVIGVERELESALLAGANRRLNDLEVALIAGTVATLGRVAFDLIVANLLSAHLLAELDRLAPRLRPGGDFVYSGALTVERRELMRRFAEVGLAPVAETVDGEWSSWRLRAEETQ